MVRKRSVRATPNTQYNTLLASIVLLLSFHPSFSLSSPRSYWRFESNETTAWGADSTGRGNNLTTTASSCHDCYSIESKSGVVGQYLRVNGSSPSSPPLASTGGSWNCSGAAGCTGSTVEFLLRAGRYFNFKVTCSEMIVFSLYHNIYILLMKSYI